MAIRAVIKSTAWEGVQAADRRAAGRHGGGDPWQRRGQCAGGPWPRCGSWRAPLEPGEPADHHQQALAAVWTALTSLEGKRGGVVRRALLGGRLRRCERCAARQPQPELRPERTVDRTPQPIGPDCVEPLRQHVWPTAAHELQCRQGHALPAVMAGVLGAATDLASLEREHVPIAVFTWM
jgi:hypothetical protein